MQCRYIAPPDKLPAEYLSRNKGISTVHQTDLLQSLPKAVERVLKFYKRMLQYNPLSSSTFPQEAPMLDRDILLTKDFKAGETIIREGETGEHLYLIISGSVQIMKNLRNAPQQIATLTSGEILGEIGILSNEPRSATAIALEDTKVVMVKDDAIHSALTENTFPLIRPLTQQLVSRFKEYEQQHMANLQRIERLENEVDNMRERLLSFELAADNPH